MLIPDFNKYSLALIKGNKIVFSSKSSGLRPLAECVKKYKSKIKDCILHDKIIGLAAARLVVYSEMINGVFTSIASKPAIELLKNGNIKLSAQNIVDNILTKDKKNICPMELKAMKIEDNGKFFAEIKSKEKSIPL